MDSKKTGEKPPTLHIPPPEQNRSICVIHVVCELLFVAFRFWYSTQWYGMLTVTISIGHGPVVLYRLAIVLPFVLFCVLADRDALGKPSVMCHRQETKIKNNTIRRFC